MSFQPDKGGQYQPKTATSSKDCVPAVAAMLINRATVDAIRTDHAVIRKASGAPSTRGLYLYEARDAAAKVAGVALEVVLGVSRTTVRDTVASGSAVGVTIHTSITRYTTRRTNYYIGPHEVYVNAYSWWPGGMRCDCDKRSTIAHGEFTVEDPGTTTVGYLQWSASLLYRAAEKLTGGHGVNLLVAPDTEGRSWTAVMGGRIRSKPDTTSNDLGPIVKDRKYPGGRTENGGPWKRADGSTGNGWTHVKRTSTRWGWIRGEALA